MLIGISEIITQSWHIYKNNFKKLLPYMGLLLVPHALIAILDFALLGVERWIPSSAALNVTLFFILVLLVLFVFGWIYTAVFKALASLVLNQPLPHWKESITTSLPLLLPLLVTLLLTYLIFFGGLLLLIIPGIIFGTWYSFSLYETMFNNQRGMAALRSSKALVQGRWFDIFFALLVPALVIGLGIFFISFILTTLVAIPMVIFQNLAASTPFSIFSQIYSLVIDVALVPLTLLPGLVLYFSARKNPPTPGAAPLPPTGMSTPTHL